MVDRVLLADEPPAFLALAADPLRWRILRELTRSDRRVGELVTLLGRPQSVVSYHLGELRRAGLVAARRSAADGPDTYSRLDLVRCREALAGVGAALHPGLALAPVPPTATERRTRRRRVLFLCTGNSARSQMAEALLVQRSAGSCQARSAGSHPKPLHPLAGTTRAARGLDIAGRTSTHLDRYRRSRFDRVVTLCDKVREVCPELPGAAATAHWSIPDPAAVVPADAPAAFEATADELTDRIDLLIAELQAG